MPSSEAEPSSGAPTVESSPHEMVQIIDEESSLSTATSLTSLITAHTPHTLRTDVDSTITAPEETNHAPIQRNRSLSVPNSVFLSPESADMPSRNRSNPRTRTPMRHASPLLVTGRLFTEMEITGQRRGGDEELGRGETIPEEAGE